MNKEIIKRIKTSIFLISLLTLAFYYSYILIISLIIVSIISWIEFNGMISRIFINNTLKKSFLKFSIKASSLIYLTLFSFIIFNGIMQNDFKLNMIYLFSICVCSDIGGFVFGKTFKGRKLTKISPNKTISGTIGSFLFSFIPLILFSNLDYIYLEFNFMNILFVLLISFVSQLGDLFISIFKRKAKIKDTGNILPGHGGVLDRVDGIIFALPFSYLLLKFI